ncbi:MAG TPA: patatin-like phospholipase family protein, partial [Acidimicrobiales bacterium]|nr:patatin-like phospholipase family protein [Acidimicrobiales bacterium]
SIGVVALDGSDAAAQVAEAVSTRLGRTRRVRRITSDELRSSWEQGGTESVASRLAAAEDGCDSLVISLGPGCGEGADELAVAVLRQTDLVVGVAAASGDPDRRTLAALGRARRPLSLALVHADGRAPTGTLRWLDAVSRSTEIRSRIQVRAGNGGDLDRLARTVVGRSIGVVLGGGGARGFAHIGVLRALDEADVPVDLVGGSSMGAVIGAQFAMGLSAGEMLERNTVAWARRLLLDFGLPTLSLLRGRGATRVIEGFFGNARIEDLLLGYFCTTVDLSEFKLHVARRGQVAEWVRASATVPGLWPPLVDGQGHLHVDGGMLNNVPTDVMRAEQAGTVIGVDVCSRQSEMRVPQPVRSLPAGLALVRARYKGQWYPSILDVLNRANLLASLQHQQSSRLHADLLITPPVEDEGFAAFDRVGRLAEIGYRAAAEALEGGRLVGALSGTL